MAYNLVLYALAAPLTADHGILAVDTTPNSGFFFEQGALNTAAADDDFPARRTEDDLPRAARIATARQAVAEASIHGPLHCALVRAADNRSIEHLGYLQRSPTGQIAAIAPTLRMGDSLAYAGEGCAEIWGQTQRLRVINFDDADLLVRAAHAARAHTETVGADAAILGVPSDDAIRAFVFEHAGTIGLITRG